MNCYYKILGVSTRASQEEIKRSFRLLALRWHPDRNPQDPKAAEHFREALEAYETLVDPGRRGKYDRSRGYGRVRARPYTRSFGTQGPVRESLKDIVEESFGIRFEPNNGARRGVYDIRFDLQVSKDSLGSGIYEDIVYNRSIYCRGCVGRAGRHSPRECKECNGSGEIEESCSVRIWVPPHCEHGARLRVSGAGDCLSPGAPAGDLVVLILLV